MSMTLMEQCKHTKWEPLRRVYYHARMWPHLVARLNPIWERNLSFEVKIKHYKSLVVSIILYGWNSWAFMTERKRGYRQLNANVVSKFCGRDQKDTSSAPFPLLNVLIIWCSQLHVYWPIDTAWVMCQYQPSFSRGVFMVPSFRPGRTNRSGTIFSSVPDKWGIEFPFCPNHRHLHDSRTC